MKPLAHSFTFLCLLAVVLALRVVGRDYYSRDLSKVMGKASEVRAIEIQAGWKSRRFKEFNSEETKAAILEKIHNQELNLSDLQKAKLEAKVEQLLHYFDRPTFEDYYRLKTQGFHYQFLPKGVTSNLLAQARKDSRLAPSADTKETVRFLWNKVHQHAGEMVISRIRAVALDSVQASVSHTNSGTALIMGPVKQGFTVAAEITNPGFYYGIPNTPESVPLLFEFSFLAKVDESAVVGPLHISLLWLDQDQEWALNRLIADSWLRLQTLF